MSSLSIWTYYLNNKRKVIPVTGILVLAILVIASTGTLTGSLYQDQEREIAFYDHYAIVFSNQRSGLSDAMLEQLESHPAIAEAIPMERRTTPRRGLFSNEGTPIYYLSEADQKPFAGRLGWDLVEGHLPEPGTNEVAMTENFLRNRGLGVGDSIGEAVDEEDWLAGEWVVVGAFVGTETIGGIANLGYLRDLFLAQPGLPPELTERPQLLALAPEPGKEFEMEAFLDSLLSEEVFVVHRSLAQRRQENLTTNIDTIVWILNVGSIVVLSLALGLLNIIYFMQRANEFGLLAALGYARRFLVRRAFLEVAVTVALGWVVGILFSYGIYSLLNTLLFVPRGLETLPVLTGRILMFTVPVPITVIFFSIAIVTWQLWRMDPVAIIERRD